MKNEKLPIGYWLKKADVLLTEGINQIQSEFGMTRTEWQILNLIAQNAGLHEPKIFEVMKPFADDKQSKEIIKNFITNKTVEGHKSYELTERGKQLHDKCLTKQIEFRKKAMNGVSDQQYQETVKTLTQIVNNLSGQK